MTKLMVGVNILISMVLHMRENGNLTSRMVRVKKNGQMEVPIMENM